MDAARKETDSTMSFKTVNTPRPPARDGQLSIETDDERERGETEAKSTKEAAGSKYYLLR